MIKDNLGQYVRDTTMKRFLHFFLHIFIAASVCFVFFGCSVSHILPVETQYNIKELNVVSDGYHETYLLISHEEADYISKNEIKKSTVDTHLLTSEELFEEFLDSCIYKFTHA